MTHVWNKWLWYLYSGDDSDFSVLVITPGDHSEIRVQVMTLISVCLWWLWYIGTGVDCYLVYCWWIWYLSTNIPMISAYWWWLWHQYTADDSDICPLVKTLITVYWWWLWHLCTGHNEKKITHRQSDRRQTCINQQLQIKKFVSGLSSVGLKCFMEKVVAVFRILLSLWYHRSQLSAVSRRLFCIRKKGLPLNTKLQ